MACIESGKNKCLCCDFFMFCSETNLKKVVGVEGSGLFSGLSEGLFDVQKVLIAAYRCEYKIC